MASQSFNPAVPMKREWGTALRALRQLLADGDDTVQVFRIMRALNGDTTAPQLSPPDRHPGGRPPRL